MREINQIILHCTATPAGREVKAADVERWHVQRGFTSIGYHYLIELDGNIVEGRPLDVVGAHCRGNNVASVGVCYVGGLDASGQPANTMNGKQRFSLGCVLRFLCARFPSARIYGHNQLSNTACPAFDVPLYVRENLCDLSSRV